VSELADLTWPEIEQTRPEVLVVPVGSTEQHGPHLPFSTDTDVAQELGRRLVRVRAAMVLAPALPYGSAGEHQEFPGTLSIGQAATELVLTELGRSAASTFPRTLFVVGHGGNAVPVRKAVATLRAEGRDVVAWSPSWSHAAGGFVSSADLHAGHVETSVQLVLNPGRVHPERAVRGSIRRAEEILPLLRSSGVRAADPNGVLGDPTAATAAAGEEFLDAATAALVQFTDDWRNRS
jgi:mycofactocin precursor peptide peptidase